MSPIIRNFIAKGLFKKSGVIANNKSVEFSANALEQRLKNLGVDPNTIKSEGELNQILSFVKQAEDQAFNQKFGNALSGNKFQKKAEVVDLKNKKLDTEKPILGGTQETDEQILQRLKKGNEDSINRLKNKKDPPEELAGGGVAGLLGERPGYQDGLRADAPNPRILELMLNEKMSYEDAIKEFEMREKQRPYIEERMGTGPGPILEAASGGIARTPFKMGKRAFLKFMGAGAAGIAGLKTGLFGLGKKAAVKEVAKEVATGGPPPHFLKLVAKIKALGDDATPKYGAQPREKVTSYKDYTLSEELDSGRTTIQRFKQSEVDYYDEMLMEDVYMSHTPGKGLADETTKGKNIPDDYVEDTSYMRTSGPQKGDILDTVDGIPDDILEELGEAVVKKADGGRIGYSKGKIVTEGIPGLLKLVKDKFGKKSITTADKIPLPKKTLDRNMFKAADDRLNDKRQMTENEYQDFADEIGENIEAYDFDGTVGDSKRIIKDIKDYEADMFAQYKMGKLDPVAGDKSPARKKFLEKKLEDAELSGDNRLITQDEVEELSSFDLGTEMDKAKLSTNDEIKKAVDEIMSDTSPAALQKSIEVDNLMLEYPGMSRELAKQIANDPDPKRKADVLSMVQQTIKMGDEGMSGDEIIDMFKKGTDRTKQAKGGRIKMAKGGLPNILGF